MAFLPPNDAEFEELRRTSPGFAGANPEAQDQMYAAHLFMREAHQATAEDWASFGQSFDTHAIRRGEVPTGSRMRQAGGHLFAAASLDPHTELQNGLHGSNTNAYANNGGFIAFELEHVQTRRQRTAVPPDPGGLVRSQARGGQGGANSLEFHPPGGTHVEGAPSDMHGSYIRPRGGRDRALSVGAVSVQGGGHLQLPTGERASSGAIQHHVEESRLPRR